MAQTKAGALKVRARIAGVSVEEYAAREAAGEKFCTRCASWKVNAAFGVDPTRHDGRANYCSACRCRNTGARYQGPAQWARREKAAAGLGWCRECAAWLPLAQVRNGRCQTHTRAYDRDRYAIDDGHRHRRRQHARSRKRNVEPLPMEGAEELLARFDGRCAYCADPATTWDHIHPVSKGGRTAPGNVVPACHPCNSSKKDRDVAEWLEARGLRASDDLLDVIALGFV